MKRLSSCLIIATLVATALPAVAQQRPPQNPPQPAPRLFPDRPYVGMMPALRSEYEMMLDEASGNNIPAQPLARVDLANRVSTLIELGRCSEARGLAQEAGDRQMALRARQLCRVDRGAA